MTDARPFVKWIGGKAKLADQICRLMPLNYGGYHEPFLGGGAVFFNLAAIERARHRCWVHPPELSDANQRLIRAYRGLRDRVDEVIATLHSTARNHSERFYYELRDMSPEDMSNAECAAWFIYMNKAGFNGLYRVNKQGKLNTAWGKHETYTCDESNLRRVSSVLRGCHLSCVDFRASRVVVSEGDVVYFDSPYVPMSATANFTGYTADGFGDEQQIELRNLALELRAKGAHVLLSNSAAPRVRELYAHGFEIFETQRSGRVSCKGEGRSPVKELIMRAV